MKAKPLEERSEAIWKSGEEKRNGDIVMAKEKRI